MRTQSIEERVNNEIALLKAIPQNCLDAYARDNDGLGRILHDFPGSAKHSRTGCWLERYATLHELPFWGQTGQHLEAAGVEHARADWLQNEVYQRNDIAVSAHGPQWADKAEEAMRRLIRERIIAAEALDSKPNVCSMVETDLLEVCS